MPNPEPFSIDRSDIPSEYATTVSWGPAPLSFTPYEPSEVEFEEPLATERIIERIKKGRELKRKKKAEEEQVEIDEKSFFDILSSST